jgi:hypothetical protein
MADTLFNPDEYNTDYKTDDEIVAMLPKIYKLLESVMDTYMDIVPEYKKIVLAWIMAAPYYESFYAFPYLFINASKRSGKTRLLKLLNALLPDSIMIVSLSESALFRSKGKYHMILIDEAERMHSRQKENLIDLLNAGYKKGGKVIRVSKDKKGQLGVDEYEVYGPIALANIWGLDSVLESRCLTVVLQRTSNRAISNKAELFDFDPRIAAIKNYFYGSLVYVGSIVQNTYFNMVEVLERTIYNINILTLPTLTYTKIESNTFLEAVQVGVGKSAISGRDLELYLPLLVTTYTTGLPTFNALLEVANSQEKERQEEDAEEDWDTNLAVLLYQYMQDKTRLVIKDFIAYAGFPEDKLRPESMARFMKRAAIIKSRRRMGRGNEYEINIAALTKYLQTRGALEMQVPVPTAPQSKLNADQAPGPVSAEAGSGPALLDTGVLPITCPECGNSTLKLWQVGGPTGARMCKSCLDKLKEVIK